MKIVLTVVFMLLLLWWLIATRGTDVSGASQADNELGVAQSSDPQFISAVQPVANAVAKKTSRNTQLESTSDSVDGLALASDQNDVVFASDQVSALGDADVNSEEIRGDFEQARTLVQQGDRSKAITILKSVIADNPRLVEPYVNLASLYAADGQLLKSREVLMQGLNANDKYAALFANLQKLHGALAANSYQAALAEPGESISTLDLALLDSIDVSPANQLALTTARQQLLNSQEQLANSNQRLSASQQQLVASQSKVAEIQGELATTEEQLQLSQQKIAGAEQIASKTEQQIADFEDRLAVSSNELQEAQSKLGLVPEITVASQDKIQLLERQLGEAQQTISSMLSGHKTELAALQAKIDQQEVLAVQEQTKLAELAEIKAREQADEERQERARRESELAAIAKAEKLAKVEAEKLAAAEVQKSELGVREQNVIAQIESWASAWSNQDVAKYVSHYADNYSTGDLSHSEWLAQREIRLTNKQFIRVGVADFQVSQSGADVLVTFSQHYQSNTMDDRIRKQLKLQSDGGDWSQAKIIAERVVR